MTKENYILMNERNYLIKYFAVMRNDEATFVPTTKTNKEIIKVILN